MSGSLSDEWNKIDWNKAFMDKCREAYKPTDLETKILSMENKIKYLEDMIDQIDVSYNKQFHRLNNIEKHLKIGDLYGG